MVKKVSSVKDRADADEDTDLDQCQFVMAPDEWKAFIDLLEHPVPNERLDALVSRTPAWERPKTS